MTTWPKTNWITSSKSTKTSHESEIFSQYFYFAVYLVFSVFYLFVFFSEKLDTVAHNGTLNTWQKKWLQWKQKSENDSTCLQIKQTSWDCQWNAFLFVEKTWLPYCPTKGERSNYVNTETEENAFKVCVPGWILRLLQILHSNISKTGHIWAIRVCHKMREV